MIGFDICRLLSLQSAVYQNLIGLFHINEIPEKIDYHKFAIINDSNHWFAEINLICVFPIFSGANFHPKMFSSRVAPPRKSQTLWGICVFSNGGEGV